MRLAAGLDCQVRCIEMVPLRLLKNNCDNWYLVRFLTLPRGWRFDNDQLKAIQQEKGKF